MRTLHLGLRVADIDKSLAFYTAVGYEVVGRVPETPLGELTMIKLPNDEFVTIELVNDPSRREPDRDGTLSHFVIQVESLDVTVAELAARGIDVKGPVSPGAAQEPRTTMIVDPDGNQIELVEWPAGHADGMSAADWPS